MFDVVENIKTNCRMDIPERYLNKDIYRKAKKVADNTYEKPSAYKSAFLVREYKRMGGKLRNTKKPSALKRWALMDWKNLSPYAEGLGGRLDYACGERAKGQKEPSVCRPKAEAKKYSKEQIRKAIMIKKQGKQIDWSKL